MIEREICQYGF